MEIFGFVFALVVLLAKLRGGDQDQPKDLMHAESTFYLSISSTWKFLERYYQIGSNYIY